MMFKSNRCKKCKLERASRFCLRISKNICWHCCNELRVDQKCASDCKYSLKKENNFNIKARVDSQAELYDLFKKEMDFWIIQPQQAFSGKIPLQMSETKEGKAEIENFFNGLMIPQMVPMTHLKKRLHLNNLKISENTEKNNEMIAMDFLDRIIEQEWEKTIEYLYFSWNYQNPEIKKNYLQRISQNKILKKLTTYSLQSSSLSENKEEALIHFELNRKYDLTIVMKIIDDKWKVRSKILGEPNLYLGENEAIQQVAILLSKDQLGNVYPLLSKFSSIYIDSADFQYYWSIYYTMSGVKEKAKPFLFNAVEIDPYFVEAIYNYAFILHTENRLAEAEKYYKEILEIADDAKTFNNLASILIDKGKYEEAEKLLMNCLKLKPDFEIARQNMKRLKELTLPQMLC